MRANRQYNRQYNKQFNSQYNRPYNRQYNRQNQSQTSEGGICCSCDKALPLEMMRRCTWLKFATNHQCVHKMCNDCWKREDTICKCSAAHASLWECRQKVLRAQKEQEIQVTYQQQDHTREIELFSAWFKSGGQI